MIDTYIAEWERDGHIWANECEGTRAQRIRADELFPQVLERLHELDELELHSSHRIWDYCVGNFGSDPVAEIIEEL